GDTLLTGIECARQLISDYKPNHHGGTNGRPRSLAYQIETLEQEIARVNSEIADCQADELALTTGIADAQGRIGILAAMRNRSPTDEREHAAACAACRAAETA